jgi:glycosyltransferase involved in cell wall biosynthesis
MKINPGTDFRINAGISSETKIIAQIGQLIPWKKHMDFILSAEKVLSKFTNVKFFIVGSDIFGEFKTYREELQQLIRNRNLESSFHFIDQVVDISSVLNCIDILFHPAIDEPFGRIIIEAMFLQKPVLAANSCGPKEIIIDGQTGFLFRPADLDHMAERMLYLLENPQLCNELGLAGKKRVEDHFDNRHQVKLLEKIFDNLLNR